ncbi:MAG: cysteine hydrolase [Planctomycetes bacterium]|nr:cysteine hydrolase [Planctomycetota bacterium]
MIRPAITLRRKRMIVDVDTQRDFFLASGAKCIRNHRRVLVNIRRVMAWSRLKNVRMVSTVQGYDPSDREHPYCVKGTYGQEKISYTMRERNIRFAADGCTDLPRDIFKDYDQVILQKRCVDPCDEPRADRILSELAINDFIVFGAVAEDSVKATVLGLLARKKHVTVLTDATGSHDKAAAEIAFRQMEAKGAKLSDTKSLFGSTHLRLVGTCECDRCQGKVTKTSVA